MSLVDRIDADPRILCGKPCIRGTRLAVEFILDLLAAGETNEDLLENYPGLTLEDIQACIAYASLLVKRVRADSASERVN